VQKGSLVFLKRSKTGTHVEFKLDAPIYKIVTGPRFCKSCRRPKKKKPVGIRFPMLGRKFAIQWEGALAHFDVLGIGGFPVHYPNRIAVFNCLFEVEDFVNASVYVFRGPEHLGILAIGDLNGYFFEVR